MTETLLPILALENKFKHQEGQKEVVNFGTHICITKKTENHVYVLAWEVEGKVVPRKFASITSALREIDISISLDNAVEVPSSKYDFDYLHDSKKNRFSEVELRVLH